MGPEDGTFTGSVKEAEIYFPRSRDNETNKQEVIEMPYSYKKISPTEITIYKKDTGKVVGHTTPAKKDAYMAALHMHEPKSAKKSDP